jgi:hypothetical protein
VITATVLPASPVSAPVRTLPSQRLAQPTLLALDLGTATGWALRTPDARILSGKTSFKPSRYDGGGMRYLRFRGWLASTAADAGGLTAVYFEEVRRHVGTDAAHLFGGFLATLSTWCEHHGIPLPRRPGRHDQAVTIACFDRMPRANLTLMTRSPTTAYDVRDLTDAQVAARERVARALDALGGHGSPAASCVWQVVGMQTSIREWALRQGWGGRPVSQENAQGILVAALGVLAKHYGIRDSGARRCA